MLVAGMPDDALCRRLVEITRAALDRHYGAHGRPAIDGNAIVEEAA
jgi:hypothetical protein